MKPGRMAALILASLGGLIAIGFSVVLTGNLSALWGLLAVDLMLVSVNDNQVTDLTNIIAGLVMLILSFTVTLAVYATGNISCLWGLVGVAIAGHTVTGKKIFN